MAHQRWDDLQAFLAIARAGRLTTAARVMGVEHTTLSRRLLRLEASLGLRLFDRRALGYRLTAEGTQLLPRAEAAEAAALTVWSGGIGADAAVSGVVRIGSPEAFGTFCLAGQLSLLALQHPRLNVELIATPRNYSLSKREADIAIGLSRPQSGRLHAARLTDYELGLFGSAAYLNHNGNPASLGDLRDHRLIGYIDDLVFAPELDYFTAALPGFTPMVRISNVLTQMQAVESGFGLCILPCFMASTRSSLTRVLEAEVRLTRSYWLLSHSDTRDIGRISVAIDFVRDCVARQHRRFLPTTLLPEVSAPRHQVHTGH